MNKRIEQSLLDEIKATNLPDFFDKLGMTRGKSRNGRHWFYSPFHAEKTPSLNVFRDERGVWVWKDWGDGRGGDIIRFWQIYRKTDFRTAVDELISEVALCRFAYPELEKSFEPPKSNEIEILKVKTLENKILLRYAESRKIKPNLAKLYLCEVYYQHTEKTQNKPLFALGLRNDKGGYELRNQFAKSGSKPKSITSLEGQVEEINIFEGMFDFLAALSCFKVEKPKFRTLILNSLSFLDDELLAELGKYRKINSFLDNDTAGETMNGKLAEIRPTVFWTKKLFPDAKDFAEGWEKQA
jgi:DNA primase